MMGITEQYACTLITYIDRSTQDPCLFEQFHGLLYVRETIFRAQCLYIFVM
nr:hypothetical protein Iba_chr14fCG14130 [Ipomoea batatas]